MYLFIAEFRQAFYVSVVIWRHSATPSWLQCGGNGDTKIWTHPLIQSMTKIIWRHSTAESLHQYSETGLSMTGYSFRELSYATWWQHNSTWQHNSVNHWFLCWLGHPVLRCHVTCGMTSAKYVTRSISSIKKILDMFTLFVLKPMYLNFGLAEEHWQNCVSSNLWLWTHVWFNAIAFNPLETYFSIFWIRYC